MSKYMFQLYLASQSPRRRDLLTGAGVPFTIVNSSYSEDSIRGTIPDPRKYVSTNAINKGLWVVRDEEFQKQTKGPSIVLSSDTIVVLGKAILEKPKNTEAAVAMLLSLSGKKHEVLTSLCFHFYKPQQDQQHQIEEVFSTEVHFRKLSEEEVRTYVATGEPMDKAGSYALQGQAASFIKRIDGSNTSVMGLPLAETVEWLNKAHLIFKAMG